MCFERGDSKYLCVTAENGKNVIKSLCTCKLFIFELLKFVYAKRFYIPTGIHKCGKFLLMNFRFGVSIKL